MLALLSVSLSLSAKVWINEFMQSNVDCLMDELIDFPDSWVELYNDSGASVNIKNWYISIDPNHLNGWKIMTDTVIPAKGYLLIYCDKAASGLHASFRIDSGKGDIYLFDSGGVVVDQVIGIAKQPAPNISRARTQDGGSTWGYLIKPTPAAKNEGEFSGQMLLSPQFSIKGGIYKTGVTVALSLPAGAPPDVKNSHIRYTTDGSEPTAKSASYSGEIAIEQSTSLRATIIAPGYLINRSATQSYIITDRDFTLPVVSISTNPEYLNDDKTGIYVKGDETNGIIGNCLSYKTNFNNNWRRPMNIEYFPSQNSASAINQLGEMRIAGGCSRSRPQKSLILYANKRFGENRYNYPVFEDKPNLEIKSFMLRNSGDAFLMTNFLDAAVQLFMGRKVDVDYQAFQPAIVFINGEYWGIQNIRERSNADFVFSNYGLDEDNNEFDMIDSWTILKAGDKVDFDNMMTELGKSHDKIPAEKIMNMVDLNEFINYMILEIHVGHVVDFPWNNHMMWKPKAEDGKWRFILKDLDRTINHRRAVKSDSNALVRNAVDPLPKRSNTLFKFLLTQESFKKEFYTRFAVYLGDILHYNETNAVIDSIKNLMGNEMPHHLALWRPKTPSWDKIQHAWELEVDSAKIWFVERQPHMYKHLNDFFGLGGVVPVTITVDSGKRYPSIISFNDIDLQTGGFDGMYYKNEEIKLAFKGNPFDCKAWRITYFKNGSPDMEVTTYNRQEVRFSIANEIDSVAIELFSTIDASYADIESVFVLPQKGGIEINSLPDEKNTISVYNAAGQLIAYLSTENETIFIPLQKEGLYIVRISNKNTTISRKTIL